MNRVYHPVNNNLGMNILKKSTVHKNKNKPTTINTNINIVLAQKIPNISDCILKYIFTNVDQPLFLLKLTRVRRADIMSSCKSGCFSRASPSILAKFLLKACHRKIHISLCTQYNDNNESSGHFYSVVSHQQGWAHNILQDHPKIYNKTCCWSNFICIAKQLPYEYCSLCAWKTVAGHRNTDVMTPVVWHGVCVVHVHAGP